MIKCPNCGFDLNGDETKCPNCGYVLKSGGEMAPPPPQSNLDIPAPPADNSYNLAGERKPFRLQIPQFLFLTDYLRR